MKAFTLILCFVIVASLGCKKTPSGAAFDDINKIVPGRHMTERQAVDIALNQLPPSSTGYSCEFKDGWWEIREDQEGVSPRPTFHASITKGLIGVESKIATRIVLRVRDADGYVERVKTPYATNNLSLMAISNAVNVASGLRVGMSWPGVRKYLQERGLTQTNVYSVSLDHGRTMTYPYPLGGDAKLILGMHSTEAPSRSDWSNRVLDRAYIQSGGSNIVSISLRNDS